MIVVSLLSGLVFPVASATGSESRSKSTFVVELEAGPVWQSGNDVQIPNDESGTRFSLVDLQGNGPWPAGRLYVTWNIDSRHSLRALAAPLSVSQTDTPASPISFAGGTFDAAIPAEATYQFNSWRLTYAHRFYDNPRWTWWVGFTAKIRDAKVELRQDGRSAKKTDVGFVPLLHVRGWYRFTERWRLGLDIDALAGGPGRAEDAALRLCFDLDDRWGLSAGYRTVEGGADVDEVYNFAWLHYAVASVSYGF